MLFILVFDVVDEPIGEENDADQCFLHAFEAFSKVMNLKLIRINR